MVTTLTIFVVALALLVFALLGAVVELYRDVRQLREVAGILDRPLNVELGPVAGTRPSDYGLPHALDHMSTAVLLVLSDRCGTCHALAAHLAAGFPAGMWLLLEARSRESAAEFLNTYRLAPERMGGRMIVDEAGRIAERLGLRTTPVGFQIESGRIAKATTVPSVRYMTSLVPNPVQLQRPQPTVIAERMPACSTSSGA